MKSLSVWSHYQRPVSSCWVWRHDQRALLQFVIQFVVGFKI